LNNEQEELPLNDDLQFKNSFAAAAQSNLSPSEKKQEKNMNFHKDLISLKLS
jgi:hypothetical protein